MPKVVLTEAHAKTCLVKVGDSLPDLPLKDLAGKSQTLKDLLYGNRLTVVLFWNSHAIPTPWKNWAIWGLTLPIPLPTRKQVNVVGIDVQDQPNVVASGRQETRRQPFPVLLDPDGKPPLPRWPPS